MQNPFSREREAGVCGFCARHVIDAPHLLPIRRRDMLEYPPGFCVQVDRQLLCSCCDLSVVFGVSEPARTRTPGSNDKPNSGRTRGFSLHSSRQEPPTLFSEAKYRPVGLDHQVPLGFASTTETSVKDVGRRLASSVSACACPVPFRVPTRLVCSYCPYRFRYWYGIGTRYRYRYSSIARYRVP